MHQDDATGAGCSKPISDARAMAQFQTICTPSPRDECRTGWKHDGHPSWADPSAKTPGVPVGQGIQSRDHSAAHTVVAADVRRMVIVLSFPGSRVVGRRCRRALLGLVARKAQGKRATETRVI